jgi:hypothetical protein
MRWLMRCTGSWLPPRPGMSGSGRLPGGAGIPADALAPRRVGDLVFPITQAYVEDVVLVDDDAIRGAHKPAPGERVAVIISGANMTASQLDG